MWLWWWVIIAVIIVVMVVLIVVVGVVVVVIIVIVVIVLLFGSADFRRLHLQSTFTVSCFIFIILIQNGCRPMFVESGSL